MSSSRPRKVTKDVPSPDKTSSKQVSNGFASPPVSEEEQNQKVSRRTAVQAATPGKIHEEEGTNFEDLNDFFRSSRRPANIAQNEDKDQTATRTGKDQSHRSDDHSNQKTSDQGGNRKSERHQQRKLQEDEKLKHYRQHISSLPDPNFDIFTGTISEKNSEQGSSIMQSKYIQRIAQANRRRSSAQTNILQSPSELSDVSTIPPTPISKTSETKSILKNSMSSTIQTPRALAAEANAPISTASDKSVRWNVEDDYDSDNLRGEEIESEKQRNDLNDLYPHEEDDSISGLFFTRPSSASQTSRKNSLDRAADLLPTPTSDMKKKPTSFDDEKSPPPLEDSMLEMLNNTDETVNEEKDSSNEDEAKRVPEKTDLTDQGQDDYGNYDDDDVDDKEGNAFAFSSHGSHEDVEEDDDHLAEIRKDKLRPSSVDMEGKRNKKARGRKAKTTVSPVSPDTPHMVKSKSKKKKSKDLLAKYATPPGFKGHAVGNREYETVPVTDFRNDDDDDDDGENVRRSKRARFKPLEYWRNEKLVYEAHHETGVLGDALGHMPVVTGVVRALPTPHARRKVNRKIESDSESDQEEKVNKKAKKKRSYNSVVDEFDSSNLRKKYEINDGDRGIIWSEGLLDVCETQIVSYFDDDRFVNLPTVNTRSKNESKVTGKAVQSFNAPSMSGRICGWLSGLVNLPPLAIKDAEGVGSCLQHFHVIECQPKALEFALANPDEGDGMFQNENAQRFLLSKGDAFFVPPGNVYRLENHSKSEGCLLSYTIFRPFPESNAGNNEKKGKR